MSSTADKASPRDGSAVESVLDLFIYAPIGFALDARELVPKLATRGREQVGLLKVAGQFLIMRGRADADRIMRERATTPAPPAPPPPPPAAARAATAPRSSRATTAPHRSRAARTPPRAPAPAMMAAERLPIPGYDTLSASQVLPRLAPLDRAELDALRRYEAAHRGRRTILGRIDQLRRER